MNCPSPTRWNYPAREALAYERGLLDDLPPGLEAPRCFGHTEHDGQHHLWLEDLGSTAMHWRLEDYGKAARALGQWRVSHQARLDETTQPHVELVLGIPSTKCFSSGPPSASNRSDSPTTRSGSSPRSTSEGRLVGVMNSAVP